MRTEPVTKRPDVELRLPADSAYAAVLRSTTAGVAARSDFTLDDIEDLRMAVGEASAMVLEQASPGGDLCCTFVLGDHALTMTVSADCEQPIEPDRDGFAWQVLSALAEDVRAETTPTLLSISLSMKSGAAS